MIRISLFAAFLVIFSSSVFAKNPQIHFCQLTGGTFQTIKYDFDEVGLCNLDKSYIGALDLFQTITRTENSALSVRLFLAGDTFCEPNGGNTSLVLLNNQPLEICTFNDGSIIDSETLIKGQSHSDNKKLKEALNTRF